MDRPQQRVEALDVSEPVDEALASLASPALGSVDLTDHLLDQSVLRALFGESGAEVRIGRYTILGRIGSGASGVVYEARDSELDRRVAVKAVVLSTGMSDVEVQRMRREAPLLAQLTHPNIVTVYDVVMEKVDGETMDRWIQRSGRTGAQTLDVFRQVARGLALAVMGVGSSAARDSATDGCRVPIGTGVAYWSKPRRDAVHEAVLASGRAHAPETSTRVLDALDRYVERWSGAYAEVCDDEARPAREVARRRSCLERAHVSLQ